MKKIVVAGIGTEIGKTFVSAVLTEALTADYWKPVQSGNLNFTDTDAVRSLINNSISRFHPEAYRLQAPLSPHTAAEQEGIEIELGKIQPPATNNILVIELAGGLMVPLNGGAMNIDLLQQWNFPVLLVSKNYLGSINHTLLSAELLKQRNIPLAGIIFNGPLNPSGETWIIRYSGAKYVGHIPLEKEVNKATVKHHASQLKKQLLSLWD